VLALLEQASAQAAANDAVLRATIAHLRGTVLFHRGQLEEALGLLHEALVQFGPEHFGTGRVLDTLGTVYAARDNFQPAREFFEQALLCKKHFGDEAGIALSCGQLGRLYLDWGHLDKAEEHLLADLKIAQKNKDELGQAQMFNHLGRVALTRGEQE